jgi:hypothetical protein
MSKLEINLHASALNEITGEKSFELSTPPVGIDALSAYQLALSNGFVGSESEWVLSLKGSDGPAGLDGADGATGPQGLQGPAGLNGATGPQGLQGPAGLNGATGPQGLQGPAGLNGTNGADGKSAYSIAVQNGFVGDEATWLATLKGADGASDPHFDSVRSVATPNATTPVHALTIDATTTEANVDIVIRPKGTGAVIAAIPDNTGAGGNKRGINSVDLQMGRNQAVNVASGAYSGVMSGYDNRAVGVGSGGYSFVGGGTNNTAGTSSLSRSASAVIGGSNNISEANNSLVGAGGSNRVVADAANGGIVAGENNLVNKTHGFIGGGTGNVVTANYSVVVGGASNNIISGDGDSFIGGGRGNRIYGSAATISGGQDQWGSGTYSTICGGIQANTRRGYAMSAYSSGSFQGGSSATICGQAQKGLYVLRRATADATPLPLTSTGGAAIFTTSDTVPGFTNQVWLPDNASYVFEGQIVARDTAGIVTSAWEVKGLVRRGVGAGTTAFVGTPTVTLIAQDAGAATWGIALGVDTTNGAMTITATGVAATTIRWVAQINTTQVTF